MYCSPDHHCWSIIGAHGSVWSSRSDMSRPPRTRPSPIRFLETRAQKTVGILTSAEGLLPSIMFTVSTLVSLSSKICFAHHVRFWGLSAVRIASRPVHLCTACKRESFPSLSHASAGQIQDCESAIAMSPKAHARKERVRAQLNPAARARNPQFQASEVRAHANSLLPKANRLYWIVRSKHLQLSYAQ